MSFLNEKTLDLELEEGANFGIKLTFEEVTQECVEHPVTGELTNCKDVSSYIDLTDLTFQADIRKTLEEGSPVLGSFTFVINGPIGGEADMLMSTGEIADLGLLADDKRDTFNPRLRFLGYYDVVTHDVVSLLDTRILQGKVYINDGVTE